VALDQSALLEVLDALKAAQVDDRIRQAAQTIYQALIEAELTAVIGAGPHQRTPERSAQRNGHRPRLLATTAGDLELRIPKLRAGSFFPSLLERRRRVDQALFAVVMEAYLHGVSTRKVDDPTHETQIIVGPGWPSLPRRFAACQQGSVTGNGPHPPVKLAPLPPGGNRCSR
jgi:putative transposase